ncbi:MAG TPA: hypothetical protein VMN36_05890, partial [Verrucomicrobiales bacterium]|nr:hypothetical protein [Verrucomicrobiales bacterium]
MTRIRNGLTTLTSLLIVLVVLTAVVSLSTILQYGESKEIRAETAALRGDITRALGLEAGMAPAAEGEGGPVNLAEQAAIETLTAAMTEKDREISQLRADLQTSIDRGRQLDTQLRALRIANASYAQPAPDGEGGESPARTVEASPAGGEAPGASLALRPAIGTVRIYQPDYGFVIIDAGSDRDLVEGDLLALRRQGNVVCEVRVTEVREQDCTADLVRDSVVAGKPPAVNDEV